MISFEHVSLEATAGLVLDDVNFAIEPGECVCITGSSGSGKTLLLEMLYGALNPTQGRVMVDNVNIASLPPDLLRIYRQSIGVLLQEDQLLPDRSIAANIALALETRRVPRGAIAKRTAELLERVDLLERAVELPEALHRGEKRRVALAQALANHPMILLADEPVADLDDESSEIIKTLLKRHAEGSTVIMATHNPKSILELGARMIRLEGGTIVKDSVEKNWVSKDTSAHHSVTPSRT
jgi:cell division transport system ATP-binding protein